MRPPFISLRSQDRYRNRRTDVPNDALNLEDLTYLLLETGDNIIREDGVGVSYETATPIQN
ncbi:hypothetical protein [uncultured Mediterranean phage uvMED]|nr:hypothetical protein [uncultured Mediterranean phage uvMED]|tara:strand:+ start:173 stop:355 length:183 start_codon:yes stop_codon:yes gene_type:complete